MAINNYLENGYFNENGQPRKEIYLDWAKETATVLSNKGMTSAALRRFYNQIKGLQMLMNDDENFEKNKHRLYQVIPLAHYGANREDVEIPQEFVRFLEDNMKLAEKDRKHFHTFIDHFQSVVAYFKEPSGRNRRR